MLMNWLGQAEQVALEDGFYSFHTLALRWLLGLIEIGERQSPVENRLLISKFFDYLEANAEDYWQVPGLEFEAPPEEESKDEKEGLYQAAYDQVIYHDSADDDQEGALADGPEFQEGFDLEPEAQPL